MQGRSGPRSRVGNAMGGTIGYSGDAPSLGLGAKQSPTIETDRARSPGASGWSRLCSTTYFGCVGAEEGAGAPLRAQRPDLVVASSRLPLTVRRTADGWTVVPGSGGLVAVLEPLLRDGSARWLGWPGDGAADGGAAERSKVLRGWPAGYIAVDLPADVVRAFYEGYANDTLWPLLHGFPDRVVLDPATWPAYREANERFAA